MREFTGTFDPSRDITGQDEFYWLAMDDPIRQSKDFKGLVAAREAEKQAIFALEMVAFAALPAAKPLLGGAEQLIARGGARGVFGELVRPALQVGAAVETALEKVAEPVIKSIASNYQKFMAHRMQQQAGWGEDFFRELMLSSTGQTSMKDMSKAQADTFIEALAKEGATAEIILPAERAVAFKESMKEATNIALEISEHLGRVAKPERGVPVLGLREKGLKGIVQRAGEIKEDAAMRTFRMERLLDEWDGFVKSRRYNVTGGPMTQTFYNTVNAAENVALKGRAFAMDGFNTFLKSNKIDLSTVLSRTVNIAGENVPASTRMGILLHTMNKSNLKHIMSRGGNNIPKSFIDEVIRTATPEEKAIAGQLFKHWNTDTPKVAEAYLLSTGKKLTTVDDYVPIIVKDVSRVISPDESLEIEAAYHFTKKWPSARVSKGFTKTRSKRADQPIELDAMAIFTQRLQEVEHYKAYMPIIRDLTRVSKNPSFRESLINKHGKAAYAVLEQWIKDVAATNPLVARTFTDKVMQGARGNATMATLGLNVLTFFKQLPSFMIGATRIGNINALRGLYASIGDRHGTKALIKGMSPQIDKRVMARELAENQLHKKLGAGILSKENLREFYMSLTLLGDRTVVSAIWRGAFDDAIRKGMGEKVAASYAEKVIRETQPFFSIKDVPELWRLQSSSAEFVRVMVMFQNQLNQYWNFYGKTVLGGVRSGNMSKIEALKEFLEGFVVPALMIGAINRSDIPRNPKEAITDVASMFFSAVPAVGQFVTSGIQGFRDNRGPISWQALGLIQETAFNVHNEEWTKALANIPEIAGYALGFPVSQPKRTIQSIIENGAEAFSDWQSLIWSQYALDAAKDRNAPGGRGGRSSGGRGGGR